MISNIERFREKWSLAASRPYKVILSVEIAICILELTAALITKNINKHLKITYDLIS